MNEFRQIYKKAISILVNKLPSWAHYHSPGHTEYVLEKAIFIGEHEQISERDMFLLKIAALYHDSGFTLGRKNHEKLSCKIAEEHLKEFRLSPKEIETICGMIMATQIPQKPTNHLENILADADLEYLGTDKFDEYSNNLYLEMQHFRPDLDSREWNKIQVGFISNHQYHTEYCRQNREKKKLENLEKIRKELAAAE